MNRFVVLHHTGWAGHSDHYDLMFQVKQAADDSHATLITYSTAENAFPATGTKLLRNLRHRQFYLHYEGPVSRERGHVSRVDEGGCLIHGAADESALKVELTGRRLQGVFRVQRVSEFVYVFMNATV